VRELPETINAGHCGGEFKHAGQLIPPLRVRASAQQRQYATPRTHTATAAVFQAVQQKLHRRFVSLMSLYRTAAAPYTCGGTRRARALSLALSVVIIAVLLLRLSASLGVAGIAGIAGI
jgi:hypothetical protein